MSGSFCQEITPKIYYFPLFLIATQRTLLTRQKTYTTYSTAYNTFLILHYLVYNTSIDYNFYTNFRQLTLFSGYTYMYLANCNLQQVSTKPLASPHYCTSEQQCDIQCPF